MEEQRSNPDEKAYAHGTLPVVHWPGFWAANAGGTGWCQGETKTPHAIQCGQEVWKKDFKNLMFITLFDSIRLNHIICSYTWVVDRQGSRPFGRESFVDGEELFYCWKTVKMFCAFFLWTLIILAAFQLTLKSTWAGGSVGAFSWSEWGRSSNMPAPVVCKSTLYIISLFILKHCLWEIQVKVSWTLDLVIYSYQLTIEEEFVWQPCEVLPWPSYPW